MGIVPIWGFQMLIAIAVSVFFKLNKALVIIAANISMPPLIPLVMYMSHITGKIWMGKKAVDISFDKGISFDTFQKSLIQYMLGAVTLATVLGLFFGILSFVLLKRLKRKQLKIN